MFISHGFSTDFLVETENFRLIFKHCEPPFYVMKIFFCRDSTMHQTAYISATIFLLFFALNCTKNTRQMSLEKKTRQVFGKLKVLKQHKVKVVMRCENGRFSFTEGEKESASSKTTSTARKPVIRINDEKEGT